MDKIKQRLILVPQYPATLRYQEWWLPVFTQQLSMVFTEVIVLGKSFLENHAIIPQKTNEFSASMAIDFEIAQMHEYQEMQIHDSDILLLCDLSYPGLFATILYHKRPEKCFAICHATSKNKYDLFCHDRKSKYLVEKGLSKLFCCIFVGSRYHYTKLNWKPAKVVYLPFMPLPRNLFLNAEKEFLIITVARNSLQKRTKSLEKYVEKITGIKIISKQQNSWYDYYNFLRKSKVMLITSKEETYGYQVIDAVQNNCVPIAPNNYSYPELLPPEYLYNSKKEMVDKIQLVLSGQLDTPRLLITDLFFSEIIKTILNETKN